MEIIKMLFIVFILNTQLFSKNIELIFSQSTNGSISDEQKEEILSLLEIQLKLYLDKFNVTLKSDNINQFESDLMMKNKTYLKEYAVTNQKDCIIYISYRRSAKSISSRLYLNDGLNSEKNNYIIFDKKKSSKMLNNSYYSLITVSIVSTVIQNLSELGIFNQIKRRL